jgi:hypothetical protein
MRAAAEAHSLDGGDASAGDFAHMIELEKPPRLTASA